MLSVWGAPYMLAIVCGRPCLPVCGSSLLCSAINQAAMQPCAPPCAARYMPSLLIDKLLPKVCTKSLHHMNTAVVASLATLLPMAAIAAAATVGRLLWRRKLRRKAVAERLETQGLLQRAGRAEGGRRGGSGDRKRARLTAMLRAQLGSDRRRGIEMLPIEVLPSGLAHQLGVLQDQEKEAGSEAALLTRAGAADLEQGIAAQLARAADSATTSQAWGPVAPSLRMSARDLEVRRAGGCMPIADWKPARVACCLLPWLQLDQARPAK